MSVCNLTIGPHQEPAHVTRKLLPHFSASNRVRLTVKHREEPSLMGLSYPTLDEGNKLGRPVIEIAVPQKKPDHAKACVS